MDNSESLLTLELLKRFKEYSSNVLIMHGAESAMGEAILRRKESEALSMLAASGEFFARQNIGTNHQA
jgi:hypothetical protein